MNEQVLICCFGIGFVAGLRSMTSPACVSWAAYLGWLDLSNGPFYFFSSPLVVILLTVWALFELGLDKTDKIGNRTGALGLIFRIVTGSASGAAVYISVGGALTLGALIGLAGAMAGTFGGYYSRRAIVERSWLSDLSVGLAEDILAVALGLGFIYIATRI
jgi:uncharacterized membrane protein